MVLALFGSAARISRKRNRLKSSTIRDGQGTLSLTVYRLQADRDGVQCYLTTTLYEPNVKIYERLGFKVCGEREVSVEGASPLQVPIFGTRLTKIYGMIRTPKTSS